MSDETKQSAVQQYLRGLEWDGRPRIATALGEGRSVEHAATLAKGSELFFSTAVRRALQPGCSVDQSLVLVAPEGAGKTRWLRALGEDSYMQTPHTSDDFVVALMTYWIVEVTDAKFLGPRYEDYKAPLAACEDTYRRPFSKTVERVPRASVVAFTTNEVPSALIGSRRFFVVETGGIPDPTAIRDQLWAEAVATTRFFEGAVEEYRRGGAS